MDLKKLKAGFQVAVSDFKKALNAVDGYLQSHAPAIQADITAGEAVAVKFAPQVAPFVAGFAAIEPIVLSEIMAVIHSGNAVVNGNSVNVTVSLGLYTAVQALVSTVSNHPAVVAAAQ